MDTTRVLTEMIETYTNRGNVYGDNYLIIGDVMRAMFPDGLKLKTAEEWNLFHLWFLIMVKMTRLSVTNLKHKDSIHDIAVYAAMMESTLRREDESNNS